MCKIITLILTLSLVCPLLIFAVWFSEEDGTLASKIVATIYIVLCIIVVVYLCFKGENK